MSAARLPAPRRIALLLASLACVSNVRATLRAQPAEARRLAFRSSLTATVVLAPAGAPAAGDADPLGCRRVRLRWSAHPRADRYAVYVGPAADGPWTPLPASNVCGAARPMGPTAVEDVEPTRGAATVTRRLFYRVAAYRTPSPDGAPAGARVVVELSDALPVELP